MYRVMSTTLSASVFFCIDLLHSYLCHTSRPHCSSTTPPFTHTVIPHRRTLMPIRTVNSVLPMKQHVNRVTAICYYHLRRLRQIRRRVGSEVTIWLVLALIVPGWLLQLSTGRPAAVDDRTTAQVQNAAARLVFELRQKEHVTPSLLQLHWLPARWRVQFKVCCLMHSIYNVATLRSIWRIPFDLSLPADLVLVSGQHFQTTTCCRAYGPSSASRERAFSRQRGTHCLKTPVSHQTLQFLENSSELIILA